jgi:hypothetical protein
VPYGVAVGEQDPRAGGEVDYKHPKFHTQFGKEADLNAAVEETSLNPPKRTLPRETNSPWVQE